MRRWFTTASAAVFIFLTGCAATPVEASPSFRDTLSDRVHAATDSAREVAFQAMTLLKTKYTWGGKSPASGLDCSGLVAHVYKQVTGLDLTGTAAQQYKQGRHVAKRDLKEGDLVFFNTLGRPKSHVGIYIGEGNFVHALNRRVGVRVDSLDDSYYARRFEGARTLLN